MSSKGTDAWNLRAVGDKVRPLNPNCCIGQPSYWINHAAVQFHSAAATPALILFEFIRWEIIACNVIYLARNPSLSEHHPPIRQTSYKEDQ